MPETHRACWRKNMFRNTAVGDVQGSAVRLWGFSRSVTLSSFILRAMARAVFRLTKPLFFLLDIKLLRLVRVSAPKRLEACMVSVSTFCGLDVFATPKTWWRSSGPAAQLRAPVRRALYPDGRDLCRRGAGVPISTCRFSSLPCTRRHVVFHCCRLICVPLSQRRIQSRTPSSNAFFPVRRAEELEPPGSVLPPDPGIASWVLGAVAVEGAVCG